MTAAQAIEYRITRQLLARGRTTEKPADSSGQGLLNRLFNRLQSAVLIRGQREVSWTDRLIAVLATTVSLFVLGSFLEELLWVVMAAGTIFALGIND